MSPFKLDFQNSYSFSMGFGILLICASAYFFAQQTILQYLSCISGVFFFFLGLWNLSKRDKTEDKAKALDNESKSLDNQRKEQELESKRGTIDFAIQKITRERDFENKPLSNEIEYFMSYSIELFLVNLNETHDKCIREIDVKVINSKIGISKNCRIVSPLVTTIPAGNKVPWKIKAILNDDYSDENDQIEVTLKTFDDKIIKHSKPVTYYVL